MRRAVFKFLVVPRKVESVHKHENMLHKQCLKWLTNKRKLATLLFICFALSVKIFYSARSTVTFNRVHQELGLHHIQRMLPRTWDEVEITLRHCTDDAILCGIDIERSNAGHLITTLNDSYFRFMFRRLTMPGENSSICSKIVRFGRPPDNGGYFICLSLPFTPIPGKCLVYSFGIRNNWSFDEDMAKYGCEVHSFDPSTGQKDHLHRKRVHFHNLGLWGSDFVNDRNWTLNKLSTIRSKLGHQQRVIDVLKMDAERAEWSFFRNVINEDRDQLDTVRQLALEIHPPRTTPHPLTKEDFIEMVFYAKALNTRGFTVYHNRQFHRAGCHSYSPMTPPGVPQRCSQETYYVNGAYAKADRMSKSGRT